MSVKTDLAEKFNWLKITPREVKFHLQRQKQVCQFLRFLKGFTFELFCPQSLPVTFYGIPPMLAETVRHWQWGTGVAGSLGLFLGRSWMVHSLLILSAGNWDPIQLSLSLYWNRVFPAERTTDAKHYPPSVLCTWSGKYFLSQEENVMEIRFTGYVTITCDCVTEVITAR